jgi:putative heme-binding domain-containing protein
LILAAGLEAARLAAQTAGAANPFASARDAEAGGRLYQTHCSYCHGVYGEGGRGPDLTTGAFRRGGSDGALYASIRNGIPGTEMPQVRASDDDVWRMVAFVRKLSSGEPASRVPGDTAAGKDVYARSGCAVCHAVSFEGGSLGPDLMGVSRRMSVAMLRESLVKPEAIVPLRYRAVRVVTAAGETVAGIRLNEDDLSIQLRDTSDNLRSFLKARVRHILRDQPSLMPPVAVTGKDLENLVAYLASLRE